MNSMKPRRFNFPLLLVTFGLIGALFAAGFQLTHIDTDVIRYLPQNDPVLADAGDIFKNHPMQGELVVDLGTATPDPDRLVQSARWVTERMKASGLFRQVGTDTMQAVVPELLDHVVDSLPVLFSADELDTRIRPLLDTDAVQRQLVELHTQLLGLNAIGQTRFIARDPLAFRNLIMARLAHLAPAENIDIYKGQLLSADHCHLLILATPAAAGTDTAFAGRLTRFLDELSRDPELGPVVMTPMGAYRAALDNERIARRDVQQAIVLSTVGIAVLLLLAFPRPLLGLCAFLPALAGTVTAFFLLALWHEAVSILALGFGGAIISITVDHGIAYLLFLDRSETTTGRAAAREVWAVGLMAALTTIGAFSALNLTGFPVLEQLGQFAAIGIAASFIFVHLVFPRIFPQMPPARPRSLPFRRLVAKLPVAGRWTAAGALIFMGVMLFFAKPVFNTDLSRMNTVSRDTEAAQALMNRVWGGGIFNKLFVMAAADSPAALQAAGDRLLSKVSEDMRAGRLGPGFLPAMVFPGPQRRAENFAAWQAFWQPERIAALGDALTGAAELGFSDDAFAPFFQMLGASKPPADPGLPEEILPLMGILRQADGTWMQFATLTPGPDYSATDFYGRYGELARVFDPVYFSETLGRLLFSTFMKMLAVIGLSVALLLFFFFLDLKLTAITLSPVFFALVGTLGTLHLSGHPLDIPALMLGIIVMGIGIDYALFLVRAYQRYGGMNDPAFERIKMTVIMAAVSTLIGFGVLCTADHALLYSAGITSFLGISYSLLGAFLLLPPMLEWYFARLSARPATGSDYHQRILARYRPLETYPRLFARFKLKWDVLFAELHLYLDGARPLGTVLDIGCGFGVPGAWVLERFDDARVYGIDPDPERIRVAARVIGNRGRAACDLAPNIPEAPTAADAALLLDVIHFLDDGNLRLTFERLRGALGAEALVVIRAVVPPPEGRTSLLWKIDALRMRLNGIPAFHRPVDVITGMLAESGFIVRHAAHSGGNPESVWIVAARGDA